MLKSHPCTHRFGALEQPWDGAPEKPAEGREREPAPGGGLVGGEQVERGQVAEEEPCTGGGGNPREQSRKRFTTQLIERMQKSSQPIIVSKPAPVSKPSAFSKPAPEPKLGAKRGIFLSLWSR